MESKAEQTRKISEETVEKVRELFRTAINEAFHIIVEAEKRTDCLPEILFLFKDEFSAFNTKRFAYAIVEDWDLLNEPILYSVVMAVNENAPLNKDDVFVRLWNYVVKYTKGSKEDVLEKENNTHAAINILLKTYERLRPDDKIRLNRKSGTLKRLIAEILNNQELSNLGEVYKEGVLFLLGVREKKNGELPHDTCSHSPRNPFY